MFYNTKNSVAVSLIVVSTFARHLLRRKALRGGMVLLLTMASALPFVALAVVVIGDARALYCGILLVIET